MEKPQGGKGRQIRTYFRQMGKQDYRQPVTRRNLDEIGPLQGG